MSLGLPPIAVTTEAGDPALQVELGRRLFMEPRLAEDGTLACASCHVPEHGFALNGPPTSFGRGGRALRRNSPSILNAALASRQFADGRMETLEEQIWGPLLSENEAWNPRAEDVVQRLRGWPAYRDAFRAAFAGRDVSRKLIGAAIAAYERSIAAGGSPFDRWFFGQDASALSEDAKEGFAVFRASGCDTCHALAFDHAAFTDNSFRNTGVEWARGEGRLGARKATPDLGRFEVTGLAADARAFRVPSLRNVALTPAYMHDGALPTLADVVDWYDSGAGDDPARDPVLRPLGLSARDKARLVAFLQSLTSDHAPALAAQARGRPSSGQSAASQ